MQDFLDLLMVLAAFLVMVTVFYWLPFLVGLWFGDTVKNPFMPDTVDNRGHEKLCQWFGCKRFDYYKDALHHCPNCGKNLHEEGWQPVRRYYEH